MRPLSPSSPVPAGTLPSQGKGPPSVQLLCSPAPPPLLQLSWLHQSQPRLGGGTGRRGASCMCLAEVTGSCF